MLHTSYIIVQTTAGDMETLEIRQIDRVLAVQARRSTAQLCLCATPEHPEASILSIRETAEAFQKRYDCLKTALLSQDLQGINRHFAPLLDRRSR